MRLKTLLLLIGTLLGFFSSSHAVTASDQFLNRSVSVHYRIAISSSDAISSTQTVLVHLSSTTAWPHKESGFATIDAIRVNVDKAAASTSTVRIGVVNFVNSSTGSVTWFFTKENLLNVSNTEPEPFLDYGNSPLRLKVIKASTADQDGTIQHLLSSEKTSGSTTWQNDVVLPSPTGISQAPNVGDIVLDISKTATAAITYIIDIFYHTERN